ncbi:ABC transporter ATP-binding protein [Tessaracoccus flavus]|uniref:Multidrug ABC transporter ATP-binding protein n=1 Tax=Tessaracoccus flavus TaxID=1610493 RepID=A0A1Q2CGI7_9ACTN|nr:ABC transporter ATP-binding protein [Tessaracoccus flavus]AQP45217.1 multidrug ABC transporter ATP-binding protein [Tessaracoccus flavus]SDY52643.1 ABC-2 type transport system ATP-binding protein [Tessaracoccus flavus]
MSAPAIETSGLTKRFRSGQVAVDGVDLAVPHGAVYGFLGPNGSGKTTTIRMLLGLVSPTAGSARLLGQPMPGDALEVLPRVGALVEGPAFHPYLSGRANLARLDACDSTASRSSSPRRIGEALERVGLTAAARKPYRQYSLGMKQRLGLAAALLRPRDLLVLDEPTNGLDPQGTREVRHLIRELAAEGATVLVSSHLLAEIEQVCTHIGIMSQGRLLAQSERAALVADDAATLVVTTGLDHVTTAAEVLRGLGLEPITAEGTHLSASLGATAPSQVAAALVHAGVAVDGLEVRRRSLEQLFVELTGEGFDVAR